MLEKLQKSLSSELLNSSISNKISCKLAELKKLLLPMISSNLDYFYSEKKKLFYKPNYYFTEKDFIFCLLYLSFE